VTTVVEPPADLHPSFEKPPTGGATIQLDERIRQAPIIELPPL
jgi:hypothetical protein